MQMEGREEHSSCTSLYSWLQTYTNCAVERMSSAQFSFFKQFVGEIKVNFTEISLQTIQNCLYLESCTTVMFSCNLSFTSVLILKRALVLSRAPLLDMH